MTGDKPSDDPFFFFLKAPSSTRYSLLLLVCVCVYVSRTLFGELFLLTVFTIFCSFFFFLIYWYPEFSLLFRELCNFIKVPVFRERVNARRARYSCGRLSLYDGSATLALTPRFRVRIPPMWGTLHKTYWRKSTSIKKKISLLRLLWQLLGWNSQRYRKKNWRAIYSRKFFFIIPLSRWQILKFISQNNVDRVNFFSTVSHQITTLW